MSKLALLIPMLSFAALLDKDNPRESFLISAVVNSLFIAFSTEILSLLHLIGYVPLAACWSLFLMALVAWRVRHKKGSLPMDATTKPSAFQMVLLALLAAVIAVAGLTAIMSAPNNWDSLTYHLPRVMHWIQNGSVAHYPTHIDRQLLLAPWSEFTIMHLQILSGGDRFANCVQWLSMVGSVIGVSLIAKVLRGDANSQIIAAVVAVSVPMGLLQATSTQNDYAVTFWLVCLAYFAVKGRECADIKNTLLVSSCLALAIFTKGTAYLIATPIMLLYFFKVFTRGWRYAVTAPFVTIALIVAVNGGHYARNYEIYGNPLSPGTGNSIVNEKVDLKSIISCVSKNIATQLATPSDSANRLLFATCSAIHNAIGANIHDPALTADNGFVILRPKNHEDFAPNPVHMSLLIITAVLLLCFRKTYSKDLKWYSIGALSSFVILSIGIKWNIYISRYFLPVFVLSAPCISLAFAGKKLRLLVDASAVCMLVLSTIVLVTNETRPLAGDKSIFTTSRQDQYFTNMPQAKPYYLSIANMIKGSQTRNVGILNRDSNMWEYLLWVLLQDGAVKYRIEHVEVENSSGKIRLKDFSTYTSVML